MKSSQSSYRESRNPYLVMKLYRIPQPKKRKTLMNTCEELIKQILQKVK